GRGPVLPRPSPRGVRRVSAIGDEVSGAVSDRVQSAGVVDGSAAAAHARDARTRAVGRSPRRRSLAAVRDRPRRGTGHPRPLGPAGRLRARPRRRDDLSTLRPGARRSAGGTLEARSLSPFFRLILFARGSLVRSRISALL